MYTCSVYMCVNVYCRCLIVYVLSVLYCYMRVCVWFNLCVCSVEITFIHYVSLFTFTLALEVTQRRGMCIPCVFVVHGNKIHSHVHSMFVVT